MSTFEKLALRGLWLILQMSLKAANVTSGAAQLAWAKDVAEAVGDDRLRNI